MKENVSSNKYSKYPYKLEIIAPCNLRLTSLNSPWEKI
jgi:hypothetical protein